MLYQAYDYLSMLELKLNHVSKRGPNSTLFAGQPHYARILLMEYLLPQQEMMAMVYNRDRWLFDLTCLTNIQEVTTGVPMLLNGSEMVCLDILYWYWKTCSVYHVDCMIDCRWTCEPQRRNWSCGMRFYNNVYVTGSIHILFCWTALCMYDVKMDSLLTDEMQWTAAAAWWLYVNNGVTIWIFLFIVKEKHQAFSGEDTVSTMADMWGLILVLTCLLQTLYAGRDLNDNQWHTVHIRRRAKHVHLKVDDHPPVQGKLTLYYFYMMA